MCSTTMNKYDYVRLKDYSNDQVNDTKDYIT